MTAPGGQDGRIVIIDIDEKSLATEGRWPWPRDRIARLVDILFDDYKISLLGMDVVWAEPDESSGLNTLENLARGDLAHNAEYLSTLDKIRPTLQHDQLLASSMKDRPIVLGYYFDIEADEDTGSTTGMLPAPVFVKEDFSGRTVSITPALGYGANLPIFQSAAIDGGHFNSVTDIDGIVRKIHMLIKHGDSYYASLSLAIIQQLVRQQSGQDIQIKPGFAEGTQVIRSYNGMEWLALGNYTIPVNEQAQTLIPYRGRQGSFLYVSATDVLNKTIKPEQLLDTVALLGTSAPGLLDLRSAPMQTNYPGVEMHANMIAGFIDQNFKHQPAWIVGAEFTILLVIGLSMSFLLPFMSAIVSTVATLSLSAATIALNYFLWKNGNIAMPIASSLLLIGGLYVLNMFYGFFVESRGKRQLAGQFGQYIPPELVEEMSAGGASADLSLAGDSRNMTVMFSDVRDFTSISEALEPNDLQNLMNEFLTPITSVIFHNRGTIDKYMGDAVMAFWGAPLEDRDHAKNAVHAALKIIAALNELQPEFQSKGWPALRLGIGVNTGVMRVGDMGSEFRKAYTVMGDAVNLGSRLEGLTKQYGVEIIVSEFTKEVVSDVTYRDLDKVKVKGKTEPVKIYEPLALSKDISAKDKSELRLYEQALKYYREMNWDLAELQFLNLLKQSPSCKLYQVYAERIVVFRKTPPGDDWDGVFTYTIK